MALPLLPLAGAGVALLLLLSKKSTASGSSYSQPSPDGSKPPTKEPAPPPKTWKEMPPALQEQVAAALGALGVSPTSGQIEGTPTADAIKLATQTAALCESQGFYDVAKELNRLAGEAAKKVPTPPEAAAIKAAAPPGLTAEQVEAIARTLTLDRDPKSIEALIKSLEKLPASPQRDNFIQMAQALLLQLAAAQSTTQTMQQIDQVITSPGWPQVQQAVQPLPPVVVPVVTPGKPPVTMTTPTVVTTTSSSASPAKPPTAEQVQKVLGTRLLQAGLQGSDVLGWQQWLRMDGFPTLDADGKFGPNTTTATKAWQTAHGLPADGKVGPATKGAVGKPAVKALPTAAAPAAAKPPATAAVRILAKGMSGADVKAWQLQLVKDGLPVATDGVFGSGTEAATKTWQKQRGLGQDGKVGPNTRAAIGRAPSAAAAVTPSAPAAAAPSPTASVPAGKLSLDQFPDPNPSAPVIKRGSPKSDYVASFQKVLNTFGYPVGTPDGIFGAGTEKATKAFQAWSLGYYKDSRIVPDGVVGPITRRLVRMRAAELVRDGQQAA
jgi:peptidoglycan hydrolase-like protein with peptidoglycan-binding domain